MRAFDSAGQAPARVVLETGDRRGLQRGDDRRRATYAVHYQGHLPIGPSCAVADVRANGALIFSNTQRVHTTRARLGLLGLPNDQIRVIYCEGSSCFGASPYDDAAPPPR